MPYSTPMRLFLAFVLLLIALTSEAATVVCTNLVDSRGTNYSANVAKFTPISKIPQQYGSNTVVPSVVTTTITDSSFSIGIVAGGVYWFETLPPNSYVMPVKVLIPSNDTNTYTLNQVIAFATNANVFLWTNSYPILAGDGITFTTNGSLVVISAQPNTNAVTPGQLAVINSAITNVSVSSGLSYGIAGGHILSLTNTHNTNIFALKTNATFYSGAGDNKITFGTNGIVGDADGGMGWGIGTALNGYEDGLSFEPNGQGDYIYSRKPISILGYLDATTGVKSNGVYLATPSDIAPRQWGSQNLTNWSQLSTNQLATISNGVIAYINNRTNFNSLDVADDSIMRGNLEFVGGSAGITLPDRPDHESMLMMGMDGVVQDSSLARTNIATLQDVRNATNGLSGVGGISPGSNISTNGGNVSLRSSLTNISDISLILDGVPSWEEGKMFYDTNTHTLCYYDDQSDVTVNVAQEQHVRVVNKTGSTILNGKAVTINGAQGNRPQVVLAVSTNSPAGRTYGFIGVATHDIANNQEGVVTVNGVVNGVDTRAYLAGSILYVSTNAGAIVTNTPNAEYDIIKVGIALNSTVSGSILVVPQDAIHVADITGGGSLITNNNVGAVTLQNDLLVKQNLSVSNTMYVNAINSDFIWGGVNYGRILAIDEAGGFYSTDAVTNLAHKTETAALAYSTNLPSVSAGTNIVVTTNTTGGRTNYEVSLASTVTTNQGSLTAIQKGNGNRGTTNALAADVVNLFSGTPSSSVYLRGDGTLATPAGGGFSGSYGGTANFGGVVVSNILAGDTATENSRTVTNLHISGRAIFGPQLVNPFETAPLADNGIVLFNTNDSHVTMELASTAQKIQGIYFVQLTDATSGTVRNHGTGGIHLNGGGDMQIWAGNHLKFINPYDGLDSSGDGTGHYPIADFWVGFGGDMSFTNAGPIKAPSLVALNSITLNGDTRSNWPSASSPTYGKLYIGNAMTNGLTFYKAAFSNNNAIIVSSSGSQDAVTNTYQVYLHTTNNNYLVVAFENTNGLTTFGMNPDGRTQFLTSKGIVIKDKDGAEYFNAATNGETSISSYLGSDIILNPSSEHIACNGYLSYVTDPVDDQDAATKIYVDTAVASDRNIKSGFEPVDAQTTLALARALPVTRWEFVPQVKKTARGFTTNTIAPGKHIGVMAQDFYAAFKTGNSDKKLDPRDSFGVALLSIQALADKNDALEKRVADLEKRLERLEKK